MLTLPRVVVRIPVVNPKWTRERDPEQRDYYVERDVEAEVLTLHLETGTMRIRYVWNGENKWRNIPSEPFFRRYLLLERS